MVGPGFGWLAGAVTVLLGGAGWLAGGGWPAGVATGAAVIATAVAKRSEASALLMGGAGVAFGAASLADGGVLATVSGAALLGGITGEMLLGHWYLIDPTLPRWALKRLAAVGAVGVLVEAVVLSLNSGFEWTGVSPAGRS